MRLSPKKFKIITLLAKGYSDKEISQNLQMSKKTVQTHVYAIMDKLNARNRTNAVALYMQAHPNRIVL